MAMDIGPFAKGIAWRKRRVELCGGETGIRTHGTVRGVDNPLTSRAGMADRTNFTPETTSGTQRTRPKYNKINEAGLYPPAHNSLLEGSIPAVNAAHECAT